MLSCGYEYRDLRYDPDQPRHRYMLRCRWQRVDGRSCVTRSTLYARHGTVYEGSHQPNANAGDLALVFTSDQGC